MRSMFSNCYVLFGYRHSFIYTYRDICLHCFMKNLFKKQSAIFVQNPSRFTKVMAKHILVWFYAPQCTRIITVGSTIAQRLCDAVRIINRLSYNHPC